MKYIPIAVAVLLMLAGAIVQGTWSERWQSHPELEQYAERLEKVPLDFADWRGQSAGEMDARMRQISGSVGSLQRTYTNSQDETVAMTIVCGRVTDVGFHTPERCYPAAGFEKGGTQSKVSIDGTDAEFFTNTYLKSEATGSQNIRVYWSWSTDGAWKAPDEFKWAFGGEHAIYKLYVMVPAKNSEQSNEHNMAADFIRVAVPELRRTLFGEANVPAAPAAAASEKS